MHSVRHSLSTDNSAMNAALLVLMRHDSDPFNRWEAGQRLALNRILHALRAGLPLVLSPAFIEAMRGVLNHPHPPGGPRGQSHHPPPRVWRHASHRQCCLLYTADAAYE